MKVSLAFSDREYVPGERVTARIHFTNTGVDHDFGIGLSLMDTNGNIWDCWKDNCIPEPGTKIEHKHVEQGVPVMREISFLLPLNFPEGNVQAIATLWEESQVPVATQITSTGWLESFTVGEELGPMNVYFFIVDPLFAPIPGATCTLGGVSKTTNSAGETGNYNITGGETYLLTISKPGYVTLEEERTFIFAGKDTNKLAVAEVAVAITDLVLKEGSKSPEIPVEIYPTKFLHASVHFTNLGPKHTFGVGFSIKDSVGILWDCWSNGCVPAPGTDIDWVTLNDGAKASQIIKFQIPEDMAPGAAEVIASVWKEPQLPVSTRLDTTDWEAGRLIIKELNIPSADITSVTAYRDTLIKPEWKPQLITVSVKNTTDRIVDINTYISVDGSTGSEVYSASKIESFAAGESKEIKFLIDPGDIVNWPPGDHRVLAVIRYEYGGGGVELDSWMDYLFTVWDFRPTVNLQVEVGRSSDFGCLWSFNPSVPINISGHSSYPHSIHARIGIENTSPGDIQIYYHWNLYDSAGNQFVSTGTNRGLNSGAVLWDKDNYTRGDHLVKGIGKITAKVALDPGFTHIIAETTVYPFKVVSERNYLAECRD
jgi:hypothetical protein